MLLIKQKTPKQEYYVRKNVYWKSETITVTVNKSNEVIGYDTLYWGCWSYNTLKDYETNLSKKQLEQYKKCNGFVVKCKPSILFDKPLPLTKSVRGYRRTDKTESDLIGQYIIYHLQEGRQDWLGRWSDKIRTLVFDNDELLNSYYNFNILLSSKIDYFKEKNEVNEYD